ncbi:hypothetical protein FRIG_00675 [Frigoribacterium faeni]|uniref:hypothetical protein n=1 Tax=Frigoribacterium faeni TaxID=145483 RepID=UPI001FADC271|nr:hypothetical protein [Frigoribacterium faeni]MCJ0699655.1 hypothetical protein [Frigoribacterium faeni]
MGSESNENVEHTEKTEKTGGASDATVTRTEETTTERSGSYVDSDIPADGDEGHEAHGAKSDEADGEFTDSDIPADR